MLTELGGSQVEVQRCSARRVPGWGPAVLTELGRSQVEVSGAQCAQTVAVEVQQCPLRAEVGEELGEELARRK